MWGQAVGDRRGKWGRAHLVDVRAVRPVACETRGTGSAASAHRRHGASHAGKAVAGRTLGQGPHAHAGGMRRLHPCGGGAGSQGHAPGRSLPGTHPALLTPSPPVSLVSSSQLACVVSFSLHIFLPPCTSPGLCLFFVCSLPMVSVSPPCSSNLSLSASFSSFSLFLPVSPLLSPQLLDLWPPRLCVLSCAHRTHHTPSPCFSGT